MVKLILVIYFLNSYCLCQGSNNCEIICDTIQWASWNKVSNYKYNGTLNIGKVQFNIDQKSGLQNQFLNSLQFSNTKYKPSLISQIPTPWMPGTNVPNTLIHRINVDSIQDISKLIFFVGSFPNENRYGAPQTGKLRILDKNLNKLKLDSLCILYRDDVGVLSLTDLNYFTDEILFNSRAPGTADGDIIVFTKFPKNTSIIEIEHYNQASASFDGIFVNVGSPNCCINDTTKIDTIACNYFDFEGNRILNSGIYYSSKKKGSCESITELNVIINKSKSFNLGNDTSFCSNFDISLNAPSGFRNYKWNTGSTIKDIQVSSFGEYWCCALDDCNIIVCDTIRITRASNFSIEATKDTTIVQGSFIQLDVKVNGSTPTSQYKIEWSPSTGLSCLSCPNPLAYPKTTQKYRVRVTDLVSGCTSEACINIRTACCKN